MLQKISIACFICALLTLSFYIGKYEVDQRPTMRGILNLANEYAREEDFDRALKLYNFLATEYVEVYGVPVNKRMRPIRNSYYRRHVKWAINNSFYAKKMYNLKLQQDRRGH